MMTTRHFAGVVVAILALLPAAWRGEADRVGIYGMIENVSMEPSDADPQRIQLWGAFMFADAGGDGYGPAQRGYLYFTCPAGKPGKTGTNDACKQDWADLKWYGGTGKGVGFGLRGAPLGRLRKETDPVASPDPYPLEGGVMKMESKDPSFVDLVARLKAALAK
jgi:hypothetical protein